MYDLHPKSSHAPKGTSENVPPANNESQPHKVNNEGDPNNGNTPEGNTLGAEGDDKPEGSGDKLEDDEVSFEVVIESMRTHAELDEVAAELGVEGFPSREEATLIERKKFLIDYDYPNE